MNTIELKGVSTFRRFVSRFRIEMTSSGGVLAALVLLPAIVAAGITSALPGAVSTPVTNGAVSSACPVRQVVHVLPWSGFLPPADCRSFGEGQARVSPQVLIHPGVSHVAQFTLLRVMATAYTSAVEECDETPHLTATNRLVRKGIVALSRDLLREFTPGAPFSFGDHVEIAGVGRFVVEDTMNPRYTGRVDIWCSTREEALAWGARRVQLKPVAAKDGRKRRDAAVPSVAIPALVSEVQQETIVPVVVPPLAPHDTVTEPAAAAS